MSIRKGPLTPRWVRPGPDSLLKLRIDSQSKVHMNSMKDAQCEVTGGMRP